MSSLNLEAYNSEIPALIAVALLNPINDSLPLLLQTAISQFVNLDQEEYSFDEFIQRAAAYWRNYLGEEHFVANFIPANLTWIE